MGQNNGWEPVEEPKGWTAVEEAAPASSSVSPIAPPPLTTAGKPNVQMHKSFLVGNPNSSADNTSQSLQDKIGAEVMGQLKNAKDLTAPAILHKLVKARQGDQQAKAELQELPLNAGLFLLTQMVGQGGKPGAGFGPSTPTAEAAPAAGGGRAAAVGKLMGREITGRLPFAKRFEATKLPTYREWAQAFKKQPVPEAPEAPPTGPVEQWGKVVKGPGPAFPELQKLWWQGRGGVMASERPNGPIYAPRPMPSVPEQGGSIHIEPDPIRPAPAWRTAPTEPTEVPSLLEREGGIPEPSQRVKPAPKTRPEPAWKTNPQPTTEVPSLLEREGGIPEPKIRVKPVGPPQALRELAEKYGYEDLSDKSVVESMRNDLERHGRILDHQRAAEADAAIRPTKADLVARAKKAKMPTAEGKPAAGPAPDPKTSLLELMQKSVEAAHANKGGPLDHATFFKLLRQALQAKGEL